jgi:hypothetical protein
LLGEQARRIWVERMSLRDDGITGGDGSGEISATNAVEREWKVVGPEDNNRPDGGEAGADIFFEVESCVAPGFFAHSSSGLPELIRRSGQFDILQSWCDRKSSLFRRGCDDSIGGRFDIGGVVLKECGDLPGVDATELRRSFNRGGESDIAV